MVMDMTINIGQPPSGIAGGGGNALYPVTSGGSRNWSASAVHGHNTSANIKQSGHELVPEYEDGSFADLIDIINPLQHIPVVGHLYRAITGDTMNPAASILGGTLFGGPLGFLSGVGNTLLAEVTGFDAGERLLASVIGGKSYENSSASMASAAASYGAASRLRI